MTNQIPFSLWLTCEHCKYKTVLFRDFKDTESKCANGMSCGKISKLDESEKLQSYISYLELLVKGYENSYYDEHSRRRKLESEQHLVKTHNGVRLIGNTKQSIQWALTQKIEHL